MSLTDWHFEHQGTIGSFIYIFHKPFLEIHCLGCVCTRASELHHVDLFSKTLQMTFKAGFRHVSELKNDQCQIQLRSDTEEGLGWTQVVSLTSSR